MKFIVREMIQADIEPIYQWMKHPHIARLTDNPIMEFADFKEKYELYVRGLSINLKIFVLLIDEVVIGKMELGYDIENKTGHFEIIVGNKQFWGTGIASKALQILFQYGFNHLGLNKITCEVLGFNQRSLNFMKKHGMHVDGILREERLIEGQFVDVFIFSLLKSEFEGEM